MFQLIIQSWQYWIGALPIAIILVILSGFVVIGEHQVGIVIKKFSVKSLGDGHFIAMNGEAGYQADTLAPGWYFGYWAWKYTVQKRPTVIVPQGEIGLIVAADGVSIPASRILGRVVDCDNFQNARKFLSEGGEKGRQLGILTAGTYRINTALFRVITRFNAEENDMHPNDFMVHEVRADKVGIVTTLDGAPIEAGEIAGTVIEGHDNFQNTQAFLEKGGRRGLQEQVLLSGSWNLNPWFIRVEQVAMTEIPIGYVGVVISYVGKEAEDISGTDFKHGNLVNPGHKGVWVTPMHPGKHPLNTRVMKVELVPTTNIVLNWANRSEAHSYDAKLSSVTVRSRDGFAFNLDVSQVIHVGASDGPKVISRVGSMQNLVDHVLEPIVGNYFRNSAQDFTVLDFLSARSQRQKDAADHIRKALLSYDVQAIDTLIGDINPPAQLMQTQMDRKIAEEQRLTYEVQQVAQKKRQELVRETAVADIQQDVVKAEKGVASGATYRKLDVVGYHQYEGGGIHYAATPMEAQLCIGEEIVVVGGGNSTGQAAVYLSQSVAKVHMLVRSKNLSSTMSKYLIERIQASSKIQVYYENEITKLSGEKNLECVEWKNSVTGETATKPVRTVFVMIGATPNTEWLRGCTTLDPKGFVVTGKTKVGNPYETERAGAFAVGDVRSDSVKRVASAVGEGSVVIQWVHQYLFDLRAREKLDPGKKQAA